MHGPNDKHNLNINQEMEGQKNNAGRRAWPTLALLPLKKYLGRFGGARPAPHFRQIHTRPYGRWGSGSPPGRTLIKSFTAHAWNLLYQRACA